MLFLLEERQAGNARTRKEKGLLLGKGCESIFRWFEGVRGGRDKAAGHANYGGFFASIFFH